MKGCGVSECQNRHFARGLCSTHYTRQLRGRPLEAPVKSKGRYGSTCLEVDCGAAHFAKGRCNAHYQRWRRSADPEYRARKAATEKARNAALSPEVRVEAHRKAQVGKYGLTPQDYESIRSAQGDRCAICRTKDSGFQSGNWAIDHDHSCCSGRRSCGKCVRGLLCSSCNKALGLMGDSTERLAEAIAYIRRYEHVERAA